MEFIATVAYFLQMKCPVLYGIYLLIECQDLLAAQMSLSASNRRSSKLIVVESYPYSVSEVWAKVDWHWSLPTKSSRSIHSIRSFGFRPRSGRLLKRMFLRRSEEHTSELQSHSDLVCRLLLEKKKKKQKI